MKKTQDMNNSAMVPSIGKQGKNSSANRANEILSTLVDKLGTELAAPEQTVIS